MHPPATQNVIRIQLTRPGAVEFHRRHERGSYCARKHSKRFVYAIVYAKTQIKEIEKKDSVLTSKHQIDRLLRAGSTYFNLNPFEVLQIDDETTPVEDIKRKYKRLSILCHPDKNQDDQDRAQTAFEIINRAWKILENVRPITACESFHFN